MTTDGKYSRDERASDSAYSVISDDSIGQLRLAAADPVLPEGQSVVVVPVTPGETIELPTDSGQGLLAELGPQGNLAIVVDGRTIILQGYAAANQQEPISIVTNDGDRIDVAAVIAETDPALDIQTAAGPAVGPAADPGAGSGIFVPFPIGDPLGGLDGAGILDPTALAYKLIDNEAAFFVEEEGGEVGEPGDNGEGGNPFPTAEPDSAIVTPVTADFQLMLVIDVSSSMSYDVVRPDGTVTTRMALQKAAVISMLETYAAAAGGSVNVKLVKFNNEASYFGGTDKSTFVDITDPDNLAAVTAAINGLTPGRNTDYDAAMATAQQGIMDPSWEASSPAIEGRVYFFSDGIPFNDGDKASAYPGGSKANAVDPLEEDLWEGRAEAGAFTQGLADKGVTSIAVGLGAQVADNPFAIEQLGRVAYTDDGSPDEPVIMVKDENQLIAKIIPTAPATVSGNVLTNDDPGDDGFGTPKIVSVGAIIDGDTTTQVISETSTGYKVETNNGILIIDKSTGSFSYTATPGSEGHQDSFSYTIQDADPGDSATSTLTVTIANQEAIMRIDDVLEDDSIDPASDAAIARADAIDRIGAGQGSNDMAHGRDVHPNGTLPAIDDPSQAEMMGSAA